MNVIIREVSLDLSNDFAKNITRKMELLRVTLVSNLDDSLFDTFMHRHFVYNMNIVGHKDKKGLMEYSRRSFQMLLNMVEDLDELNQLSKLIESIKDNANSSDKIEHAYFKRETKAIKFQEKYNLVWNILDITDFYEAMIYYLKHHVLTYATDNEKDLDIPNHVRRTIYW